MVEEATKYAAANFLRSQSAMDTWKEIQYMWMLVLLGPPDLLAVDKGSAYVLDEMMPNCEADGIRLREESIETPGKIGQVERYHDPLRDAYERIRTDLDRDNTNAE